MTPKSDLRRADAVFGDDPRRRSENSIFVAGLELGLGVERLLRRRGQIGLRLSRAGGKGESEQNGGERTKRAHLLASVDGVENAEDFAAQQDLSEAIEARMWP